MSLERFCSRPLATVLPDDSLLDAARRMVELHVGSVVVVTPGGVPIGMVTDRDLVARAILEGMDARKVSVKEVMTEDPVIAYVNDTVELAAMTMRKNGVRRLPIVDVTGELVGIVSLDDLLVLFSAELHELGGVPVDNRGP